MSRYINIDDAVKVMALRILCLKQKHGIEDFMPEAKAWLNDAPSIDIVRCKECLEYGDYWCMYWQNVINPDDFCSYGERKES